VVGERAHRVQGRDDTAVHERRREVGEHLWTVLRQHREPRPMGHPARPLRLDQLTGPSADLAVRGDSPIEVDAGRVVMGGEATDDQVRKQRLIVER